MPRIFALISLALFAGSASANAGNREWHTAAGAVICRNYFSMAEALASRNDPRWFAETGCYRAAGGAPLTVIDPARGLAAMRVRFQGETVWINALGVMGYATINGKRQGPLQYDDALRAQSKADTAAAMKQLRPIEKTEAYSDLLKTLAGVGAGSDADLSPEIKAGLDRALDRSRAARP